MASLGKALAQVGCVVAGKKALIEYLRYSSPHLIYSTALPPMVMGGLLKTLDILAAEFSNLRTKLWEYKKRISDALVKRGFALAGGLAPIISIHCGSSENTIRLSKQFFDHRILTTPFIPPSVPPRQGKLRLIPNTALSRADIARVVEAISSLEALP